MGVVLFCMHRCSTFFAVAIESDGGADELLQGGFMDGVVFVDVNGAADVAFEAGVEEAGGVGQGCSFGEGHLDDTFVDLSGAEDAVEGPGGSASPL